MGLHADLVTVEHNLGPEAVLVPAQPVVGSAKSLIKSIKAKRGLNKIPATAGTSQNGSYVPVRVDNVRENSQSRAKTPVRSSGPSAPRSPNGGRLGMQKDQGQSSTGYTRTVREVTPEDAYDRMDHEGSDHDVSLNASSEGDFSDEEGESTSPSSSDDEEDGELSSAQEEPDVDVRRHRTRNNSPDNSHQSESEVEEEIGETLDKNQLKELRRDPQVKKVLDLMFKEEKEARLHEWERDRHRRRYRSRSRSRRRSKQKRRRSHSHDHHRRSRSHSRRRSKSRRRERSHSRGKKVKGSGEKQGKSSSRGKGQKILKAPSNVTLYTPALRRDSTVATSPTLNHLANKNFHQLSPAQPVCNFDMSAVDQISNLLDRIRVQQSEHRRDQDSRGRSATPAQNQTSSRTQPQVRPEVQEGQELADQMVRDAERFKASVLPPKGNSSNNLNAIMGKLKDGNFPSLESFLKCLAANDDDDFFHLTCHVDAALKEKIEKGDFVDLDRLLPKTRTQTMHDDQLLQQFVSKNGSTYWGPPERESRISNVRRWEQAFRVYAAIYCNANPDRSAEIWQYVYVINTATVSCVWENVYFYDFTFRQLMAEKPNRSWAKTYTQLWNLAMCDHLPKNNNNSFQSFDRNQDRGASNSNNSFSTQNGSGSSWRDRCCWRFNKGSRCKKWNCRYDHRCSNCGSWSHNKSSCTKKGDNNNKGDRRSGDSPKRKYRK